MLTYSMLVPAISAVMVALLAMYILKTKRAISVSEKKHSELVDSLSKEIQGVSHGAMGVGRRVLALEKEIEDLHIRLEEAHKNDPSKVSYSEAARLVEMGASVDDLMNSCGISRPEAELVSALTVSQSSPKPIPTLIPNQH